MGCLSIGIILLGITKLFQEDGKDSVGVKELFSKYSDHRLLIIADNRIFINPFNGKIVDWIEFFTLWQERAFLTMESAREDKHITKALLEAGFSVGDISEKSLENLIDSIHEGKPANNLSSESISLLPRYSTTIQKCG